MQPFFGHQQDQQTSVGYTYSQFTAFYNSGRQFFASYLKSVYRKKKKQPIYDKWPQVKSKKYINLALIEKEGIAKPEAERFMKAMIHGNIEKSKQATDIGQIAKLPDGSQPISVFLWREHQVWERPPLPGSCAASGGRESCFSSTSLLFS